MAFEAQQLAGSWSALGAGARIGNLAGGALAAMFGEIAKQPIHPRKIGAVYQIAPLLLDTDQAGARQFFQMEGQRVASNAKLVGHDARRKTAQAGDNQGAKYPQTLGVGQSIESGDGLIFMHGSMVQRLLNH